MHTKKKFKRAGTLLFIAAANANKGRLKSASQQEVKDYLKKGGDTQQLILIRQKMCRQCVNRTHPRAYSAS